MTLVFLHMQQKCEGSNTTEYLTQALKTCAKQHLSAITNDTLMSIRNLFLPVICSTLIRWQRIVCTPYAGVRGRQ